MTWLYGGVFGGTPAPTPAMMDAHVEKRDAGEDGFLHDEAPKFGVKPNHRLDGKAHLMEYERWNRDWARGSGDDPKGLAPEYESYIRDLDKDHGHDPGLIFARDLTQQVEKYHGKGGELAKQFVTLLADRPDLQREYLGGPVPTSPPIGTFKPGGEEGVKAWIDQDRVANGLKPRYAVPVAERAQSTAAEKPVSARGLPASKPINLFDLAQEIQGLPEDEGLRQSAAHDAERARQAAQNEHRPVPEYWPQGLPPTAEDRALHKNPAHTPDLPNPRPSNEFGDRDPPAQSPPTVRDDARAPAQGLDEELPSLDQPDRQRTPQSSLEQVDPPDARDLKDLASEDFEAVAAATSRDLPRAEASLRKAQADLDRAEADLEKRMKPRHREVQEAAARGAAMGIPTGVMTGAIIDKVLRLPGTPMTKTGLALEAGMGAAEAGSAEMLKAHYELRAMSKERDAARDRAHAAKRLYESYVRRSLEIDQERRDRGAIRPDQ